MWSGEEEFKTLLEKALLKPSKGSLAAVTEVAVRDEKWCYKSVCFELEKASKKVHKKQRLNVLYIISDICRKSKARLGSKDKYGARFLNVLPSVLQKLEAAPVHHVVHAEKVLRTWSHEALFDAETLIKYEGILADAKAKAQIASDALSKVVKSAPRREEDSKPPLPSPDDYNPFQDDLPGPPPPDQESEQHAAESSAKRQRVLPGAAAKEAAEQIGSVARAQAIADRYASLAGSSHVNAPTEPPHAQQQQPERPGTANSRASPPRPPADVGLTQATADSAIPGISAAQHPVEPYGDARGALSSPAKRRRPSMFDQPQPQPQQSSVPSASRFSQHKSSMQMQQLPGPPPSSFEQSAPRPQQQELPGPPPRPPQAQPAQPQLHSMAAPESPASMLSKAQAIAARLAAAAPLKSFQADTGAPASSAAPIQPPASKQPPAAELSAVSEFEDDSDPFKGLSPLSAAKLTPVPNWSSQGHTVELPGPPPRPMLSAGKSSQSSLPPPPAAQPPGAMQQGGHSSQQRALQPRLGPRPEQMPVPLPRPPPGPWPPPGAPPAHPPPQPYYIQQHYPPHIQARPPLGPPPAMPTWQGAPPADAVTPLLGKGQQGTNGCSTPSGQEANGRRAKVYKVTAEHDDAPPPPPPLPPQTDAATVC